MIHSLGGGQGNGNPGGNSNPGGSNPGSNPGGGTNLDDKDDKTVAEAKTDAIKDLIGEAKEDGKTNVTLAVTETDEAGAIELNLIVASLNDLVRNGMGLTVQSDNGTIIFDKETLAGIAAGKPEDMSVRIVVESVPQASLTAKQQALVGNNPVIELSVWIGNTQIHDFKGTVTVKLSEIPNNVKPEDYDLLTIYRIDENGDPVEMKDAKYNAETGEITFTTDHFSLFFVAEWINPYADVNKTSWYYRSVRFARGEGLMTGTGIDTFAPETNLSRAMIVQILYNLEGNPSFTGGMKFDDVKSGTWTP